MNWLVVSMKMLKHRIRYTSYVNVAKQMCINEHIYLSEKNYYALCDY